MTYYFIDYENVADAGFVGARQLKAEDRIIVFGKPELIARAAGKIKTSACIENIAVDKKGKNYLDFQLDTYLGYMHRDNLSAALVIVSRDRGYESVADFWSARSCRIERRETIQRRGSDFSVKQQNSQTASAAQTVLMTQKKKENDQKLGKKWRKKICRAIKDEFPEADEYPLIYRAFLESRSSTGLRNSLSQLKCGKKKKEKIYRQLKDIFEEYRKQSEA